MIVMSLHTETFVLDVIINVLLLWDEMCFFKMKDLLLVNRSVTG